MSVIDQISMLSRIVTTPRFLRIKRGAIFFLPRGADSTVQTCQWSLMARLGLPRGIRLVSSFLWGLT
jgi:hypothetical protein